MEIASELTRKIKTAFGRRTVKPTEVSPVKDIDSGQALANFYERLAKSEDHTAKWWGETIKEQYGGLRENFAKEKQATPSLTAKEFLEKQKGRTGDSHLVAGPYWEPTPEERTKIRHHPSVSLSTISEIIGDPNAKITELFPWPVSERKSPNYDDLGFAFTIKGDFGPSSVATAHGQLRAQYARIRPENEQSAGLLLCVERDIGGPTGDYWVGQGAFAGVALKVPFGTEMKFLEQTVK